ncbi:MAG: DNA (cytosine-5-)-methyltransferase [Mycoplasmataceae bacterium]|nr:DNA (cytosine-5-)-methyltransferase [Mycoplasmataceae bacterium]
MDYERKLKYYKAHVISKNMGSILKINGKELQKNIGDIDLITYSFPCQDLSVAGSFHGFNQGMAKGDGTRSSLLWEIGRILTELKSIKKLPKFLLLENVANMISSRHINDYIAWKKALYKLGYQTKTYIVNARDHGLAQNRKRVYAISVKGNFKIDDQFEIIDLEEKVFPKKFEKVSKLKTRELKDIINQNYENDTHKSEALEARPNRTPSRERMFNLNYKLNDFDKYKYSRTVTTKQDRHPNAGVINLKNTILETTDEVKANYRFITTREAYLLMGFDDKDYNNVKKQNIRKEKLYQQAGNSIAIYAITAILKKIQELNNE